MGSVVPSDRRAEFRRAWDEKLVTFGGLCSIPSPYSAELMGYAGFDWLWIDLQHAPIYVDQLVPMLQATSITGTPTFVRVPWNEPGIIMRVLDAGATGVIVPMVNTAAEATSAVAACRYPPQGNRSWGPFRPRAAPLPQSASSSSTLHPEEINDSVLCVVQIETVPAVDRVDEILSVPGIDGVFVGPSDLALSAGLLPTHPNEDPAHLERLMRVVSACTTHDVMPGIVAMDNPHRWREAGFRMLLVGFDVDSVVNGAYAALAKARVNT